MPGAVSPWPGPLGPDRSLTWRSRLGWTLIAAALLVVVVALIVSDNLGEVQQRALAFAAVGFAKGLILLHLEARKRRR